jgi:DNA-binding transcriptional MerR regulator
MMKIGQFARLLKLTPRTIRYYESLGLIQPCGRTEGGFRLYSRDEAPLLSSIISFKELGLSLDEIRKLAGTADRRRQALHVFHEVLEELDRCEEKIAARFRNLTTVREEIRKAKSLIQNCPGCDGKDFDQECVECLKEEGDLPPPLNVLSRALSHRLTAEEADPGMTANDRLPNRLRRRTEKQ